MTSRIEHLTRTISKYLSICSSLHKLILPLLSVLIFIINTSQLPYFERNWSIEGYTVKTFVNLKTIDFIITYFFHEIISQNNI